MLRRLRRVGLVLVLAAAAAGDLAMAQGSRPFKGNCIATWDNVFLGFTPAGATFQGVGEVAHLGRAEQSGDLYLEPLDEHLVAPGHGTVTLTAANGDQLTFEFEGLLHGQTGEGIGTLTFTGGTGRFAHASGHGTFYALIDLSNPSGGQAMTVELDGEINY
jgi:hypothetical protein